MELIFVVSFAVILAAFTGIRAFLPLTIVSVMAKFNLVTIPASSKFINFLTDERVMAFLIIATIIEILSDKIPLIDNILDSVYVVLKPVISVISAYSITLSTVEPWQGFIISLTLALISSSSSSISKATVRAASTTFSAGTLNTLISFIEDVTVFIGIIISVIFTIILPLMALTIILLIALGLFMILKLRYNPKWKTS
ncbi:MAG: DUF4126 domain-containing protein [bacterium]